MGTDAELGPGRILGDRYRLVEAFATDPLVHVWRADDLELHRPVVCKVLHSRWMDDPDMVERFRFGAFAATRLDHENIARTYDVELADGHLYTVSEHVDGPDVRALLDVGPLGAEEAAAIGQQAAAGLAAAHDLELAHGAVCPQNLVVGPRGRLCLIDFGSIQDERTADAPRDDPEAFEPGIRDYWAPERSAGGDVEAAGDVYALGLILWEALTGRAVVGEVATDAPEGLLRRVVAGLTGGDDDPELALRAVAAAATATDPAQRPSASELVDRLAEVAGVRPYEHLAPLVTGGRGPDPASRPGG